MSFVSSLETLVNSAEGKIESIDPVTLYKAAVADIAAVKAHAEQVDAVITMLKPALLALVPAGTPLAGDLLAFLTAIDTFAAANAPNPAPTPAPVKPT